MNAFKRALAMAIALMLAESASAALLSIAQYPLFLTHRTLPNVLVIYDNSESMDGTMAGKLIAGDDPSTRGNIARGVIATRSPTSPGSSTGVLNRSLPTATAFTRRIRTGWATIRPWCSPTIASPAFRHRTEVCAA